MCSNTPSDSDSGSGSGSESSFEGRGAGAATQLWFALSSWACCSVGMLVFNKLAIKAFPVACTLVAVQFGFTVLVVVVGGWRSIHIGSARDVLRWSAVVPLFTGMILSSILALEFAPMTLVMTLRALSPMCSLAVERFYPSPLRVSPWMLLSLGAMLLGVWVYIADLDRANMHWYGIGWALLNNFLAVGDRLLQRLFLSPDQDPVDVSKSGVTLLNNLLGMVPLLVAAFCTNEFARVPDAVAGLSTLSWVWVIASCFVGAGISYTGIWVQSLISATSFLVLVNANKFAIIFIEAFILREKSLRFNQIIGATISILAGVAYGRAREAVEKEAAEQKRQEELDELKKPLEAEEGMQAVAGKVP